MITSDFLTQLHSGAVLVADGATGTNLLQRGLPRGVPSEGWSLEHPEQILRLHLDFLQAGADILLTNTFGASPLRLEATDLAGSVEQTNRRAVELARQAVEQFASEAAQGPSRTYIAGSLGPSGGLMKPYGALSEAQVFDSYRMQAQVLADSGVDLLVIETQFDLMEASTAIKAVRSVSRLPLICSFSFDRGVRTMMGVSPAMLPAEIAPLGVDVLGINCGRSLDENFKALHELRHATTLPIWFKPNAGLPSVDAKGNSTYTITPEEMGQLVPGWLEAGAQIVGGCCGTSPAHLRQIARAAKPA
jgi:5-methyltetrahydrofolate--homocysteine methyltransferase